MNQALNNTLQDLRIVLGAAYSRALTMAMRGEIRQIVVCAVAAGFLPARRSASIEPMQALRSELGEV